MFPKPQHHQVSDCHIHPHNGSHRVHILRAGCHALNELRVSPTAIDILLIDNFADKYSFILLDLVIF